MGKAITGAIEIAGAVAMGALAAFQPELLAVPGYIYGMGALGAAGLASEAAAVADALTSNRGQNTTIRQPAAYRPIVYGCQRIGGTIVFMSTTGSAKSQWNYAIVLASHELTSIDAMYCDGRQVFWHGSGTGWAVRNGVGFGGVPDGGDHTGPSGEIYNFSSSDLYAEARYGDQVEGDVIGGLTANDPRWAATSEGSPWLGGLAYLYVKLEGNNTNWVLGLNTEMKFTVHGKAIYDPRTGETAYSANPALIINDILTDAKYGFGFDQASVNIDQLIAAANICEELVECAAGYEFRYSAHYHYDTSTGPGDAINVILQAMAGRISVVGGQIYIYPAAFIGPSVTLGPDHLTAAPEWSPKRSYRDLFNRVYGTYVAPNYPYNPSSGTGDAYDRNGYDSNGQAANVFALEFQQTSAPMYAADVLHGYAADQYLLEDGGHQLPHELGLPAVLSVSQWQRLAKIELLRNRQQGTGTLQMRLVGWLLQPNDTFTFSFDQMGFDEKLLEVTDTKLSLDTNNGAPRFVLQLDVQETDPSVYEWSPGEELTPLDVPASPASQSLSTIAPPTNLSLLSSAATAVIGADGTATPRIQVSWDTPEDYRVSQIALRYRLTGTANWTDGGLVSVTSNDAFIGPITAGGQYDVSICSVASNGSVSVWVEQDGFSTGLVLGSTYGSYAIGPASLVGLANPDGTASIECMSFTVSMAGKPVTYFPSDPYTITGLAQSAYYDVYVVDPDLGGGDLVPVATQRKADYQGRFGYWWVGGLTTPVGSGSAPTHNSPTEYLDQGTRTTIAPTNAYDGDPSTSATVGGSYSGAANATAYEGQCLWYGFSGTAPSTGSTLSVSAAFTISPATSGSGNSGVITMSIDGTQTVMVNALASSSEQTYTASIPAGTDLSKVQVTVTATPGTPNGPAKTYTATVQVFEITIA